MVRTGLQEAREVREAEPLHSAKDTCTHCTCTIQADSERTLPSDSQTGPMCTLCLCVSKERCKQYTTARCWPQSHTRRLKLPLIRAPWSSPSICWCPGCSLFYRRFSRTDSLGHLLTHKAQLLCRLCWKLSTGERMIWTSHTSFLTAHLNRSHCS